MAASTQGGSIAVTASQKKTRDWKNDPPLLLATLKAVCIIAFGLVAGAVVLAGALAGILLVAGLYIVLTIVVVTAVSVFFTPACGFASLLICIWLPIYALIS